MCPGRGRGRGGEVHGAPARASNRRNSTPSMAARPRAWEPLLAVNLPALHFLQLRRSAIFTSARRHGMRARACCACVRARGWVRVRVPVPVCARARCHLVEHGLSAYVPGEHPTTRTPSLAVCPAGAQVQLCAAKFGVYRPLLHGLQLRPVRAKSQRPLHAAKLARRGDGRLHAGERVRLRRPTPPRGLASSCTWSARTCRPCTRSGSCGRQSPCGRPRSICTASGGCLTDTCAV